MISITLDTIFAVSLNVSYGLWFLSLIPALIDSIVVCPKYVGIFDCDNDDSVWVAAIDDDLRAAGKWNGAANLDAGRKASIESMPIEFKSDGHFMRRESSLADSSAFAAGNLLNAHLFASIRCFDCSKRLNEDVNTCFVVGALLSDIPETISSIN